MPADFYELLGVDDDVDGAELRRAYREKAREYHPDVNDDDRASAQFATVRRAYEVLSDPKERARYDQLGHREYVETRMDGLPDGFDFGAGRDRTGARSEGGTGAVAGGGTTTGSGAGSDRGTTGHDTAGGAAGDDSGRRESTAGATNRTSSRTGGRTSSRTSSRTGGRTGSDPGARRSTTSGRSASHRRGLRYGWLLALFATTAYATGIGIYLATNRAAVDSLVAALRADPVPVLLAASELGDVRAFAVATASAPGVDLLFPIGVVALPLAIGAVVAKFGRGAAWLYVVGAVIPLAVLVAAPVLPRTVVVELLGFVVIPLLTAAVFLVDIGRYLTAS